MITMFLVIRLVNGVVLCKNLLLNTVMIVSIDQLVLCPSTVVVLATVMMFLVVEL